MQKIGETLTATKTFYSPFDLPFFREDSLRSLTVALTTTAQVYRYRDETGSLRYAIETSCPKISASLSRNMRVLNNRHGLPEGLEPAFVVEPKAPAVAVNVS